ncbi:N-acetylgalactosamine kinase isoform X3 [Eurytemora carolleeae]|uniref:N-acetylgalactosamine kinase isoform X2 n=1 Tax=Eurytemora carolleeae TaxID=1294199 RepID=UPI000C78FC5B|nr:N-acetylgalactosamine kinase isoform X2 [Eurytemora carolleeae]XP_023336298.1 N-acetylgalactosamine kinase isoform X3 [Eurytemora carolleeae]|eukprot:XP_023336296.1 N-acetylgalactosamine kinase-like isoform X2 [Eurytemora affinis]
MMLAAESYDGKDERLEEFLTEFREVHGAPEFLIRVPGRVNLIGEHIDYCGYAVHPMAIEQDVLVCLKRTESGLELFNKNDSLYPSFKLDIFENLEISTDKIQWWSYFLCGLKGVLEEKKISKPAGLKVYISGRIPPSAGLSSSSALVVSAAITALSGNGITMNKTELASLCARAERFIGTQGGGMDQAIEILAKAGQAKLIEFNPLQSYDVQLPVGAVFVVANSLQEKNKAASNEFNSRVVECRLAAKILAKRLIPTNGKFRGLRDVQTATNQSHEQMLEHVEAILDKQVFTRADVLEQLSITDQFLRDEILTNDTENMENFKLKQRARHVYSESARVYKFRDICHSAGDGALRSLGELMNFSHSSCRDDYECSAPSLDKLVEASLSLGAYGSRLTGVGWGECTVI